MFQPKMKILVTGSTGLVGVNLVRRLMTEGHQVRILIRAKSNTSPFKGLSLECVTGDIADIKSVKRAADGCEVVFHLAGFVNMSPFVRVQAERVNVKGTENVLAACCETKVRRLVHTSSIAAIGYGSNEKPATEESDWNFADLHSPYCDTKREGERCVLESVRQGRIDAVVVNPGYILGPWDMKPSSGRLMLLIAKYRIPVYPTGGISVVHVEDVVEGHIRALQRGQSGERYILAGENLSYRELMGLMAKQVGVSPPRIPLWSAVATPLGWFGDIMGRVWPRTFDDVNTLGIQIGAIGHYVSFEKARRELGYNPRPAQEAVHDAYRWFREHDYL